MYTPIMWIIAGILIALGIVVAVRNNQILENDRPIGDSEEPDQDKTRQKIALVVLVVALFIAGMIVFTKGGSNNESSGGSIATFVPIWVAIWIPLMNKKKKQTSEIQKRVLVAVLLGTVLVVGLTVLLAIK